MYRDFSESSKQKLLELVSDVENEKWCDFTDWIGDRWLDFQSWIGSLNIKNYLDDVNAYHKKVIDKNNTTKEKIEEIFQNVNNVDNSYQSVFLSNEETLNAVLSYLQELGAIINPANGNFNSMQIFLKFAPLYSELKKFLDKLGNPSYIHDDGVHYGGEQGSAYGKWKNGEGDEIGEVVRKYFPNYSDAQILDLLYEMNHEGCNYMVWVNTIFGQYTGREDDFEKDFGFSMYDEDGYPNWDLVMADFYCSEGEIDGKEYGLTKETSEKRWEHYLHDKGIRVDVVNIDVTVDTFEELSKQGEIVVAISPLRLRNSSGKLVDTRDGGHAMVITGVEIINGKKMYKVSSWGRAYYIDPDDFDSKMRIEYQQARYE